MELSVNNQAIHAETDNEHQQQVLTTSRVKVIGHLAIKTMLHPLNFCSTLIKLGHDPFPLSAGKTWLFFGPTVYFQPNLFKYLKNIYQTHGLSIVYTGIAANLATSLAGDLCLFYTARHMDEHCPELGGKLDDKLKQVEDTRDLSLHQLIRVKLRQAIRATISHCIATTLTRPLLVVMVRQIAQYIGNDFKYAPINIFQPLRLIGAEEGPAGLFSGLIPQLIGDVVFTFGAAAAGVALEIGFSYIEKEMDSNDQQAKQSVNLVRGYSGLVCTYLANSLRYPFDVVSTVMAVTGSGLAVSMLPFSPLFFHWSDAYNYLSPFELYRGQKTFARREHGPVTVAVNGRMYASKKHFI